MSSALFRDLFTRISERVGESSAITEVAKWLEVNTYLNGKPFSFKDHEFQIEICNCTAPYAAIQKPTQVGMSELSFRIALALCAIRQHFGLIYIFPSATFAAEVSKMRIAPIIEASPKLTELMVTGADSTMSKRIGSSYFYMGGAATKSQAISRPVQGLIIDEKDFANQSVLTSYQGRLRHVDEQDQFVREFSTPTVAEYGINEALAKTTAQRFMVRCSHCGERQAPDFKTQVTIPGFTRDDFSQFTKDEIQNPRVKIDEAYIRCSRCGKSLELDIMATAEREWVALRTEAQLVGFEVKPFDLPRYNNTPRLVRDFGKYADPADYWNFVQGEVFQSDTNQVNAETHRASFILRQLDEAAPPPNLGIGIDVGHTYCYAMAGFRVRGEDGKTRTHAIWRKRYSVHDGEFIDQIKADVAMLEPEFGVMDIGPDASLSRAFTDLKPGKFLAGSYRRDAKGSLEYQRPDPEDGVVEIQRTKGFNALVSEINHRLWCFAQGPDQELVVHHFQGMKRVQQTTDEGELSQQWVKIGDKEDHFLHAAMYLKSALDCAEVVYEEEAPPVLPMFSGVSKRSEMATITSREAAVMAKFLGMIRGG